MGKFKNAMKTLGEVADAYGERNKQIEDMTRELVRRGYDVDPIEAKKIARVLVDSAEVTWK